MNLWLGLLVGFKEIWAHKFRSILTMLGVILGVASLLSMFSLTAGIAKDNWSFEILVKNAFDALGDTFRYSECATSVCGVQTYITPVVPRTIGVKFGQKF